jgi:arylsulfatase A-like enzyme
MREPAIFRWPSRIKEGVVTQALATTMDLHVTALSLAGANIPNDRVMDGVDMSEILFENKKGQREQVLYYRGTELYAIREGAFKLHFTTINPYIGESPVVQDPPLLFNLNTDPSEKYNIAMDHPDVVAQLKRAADAHLATVELVENQLIKVDTVMLAPIMERLRSR